MVTTCWCVGSRSQPSGLCVGDNRFRWDIQITCLVTWHVLVLLCPQNRFILSGVGAGSSTCTSKLGCFWLTLAGLCQELADTVLTCFNSEDTKMILFHLKMKWAFPHLSVLWLISFLDGCRWAAMEVQQQQTARLCRQLGRPRILSSSSSRSSSNQHQMHGRSLRESCSGAGLFFCDKINDQKSF